MESQHLLSNEQYEYLTSQTNNTSNPSEERRRISGKVDKIFKTLEIITDSDNISQDFKDKLFLRNKATYFLDMLTKYDPENTAIQESNKQDIIIRLIEISLRYLQLRYKETKLISKEITHFMQLLSDLQDLTHNEIEETEATKMYKTRKLPTPPLLNPARDTWTALCIYCFKYTTLGKNKEDSLKRIIHARNCSFKMNKKMGKRTESQFFKIIPPKKN